MPRFVVLYHERPPGYERPSHWDLMLEADGVLRTWALAELPRGWQPIHERTARTCGACPPLAVGETVDADQLADHRLAYLDCEGPVSGGRGSVTRVTSGTYETVSRSFDRWQIAVAADQLQGNVLLARKAASGGNWRMELRPPSDNPVSHAAPP